MNRLTILAMAAAICGGSALAQGTGAGSGSGSTGASGGPSTSSGASASSGGGSAPRASATGSGGGTSSASASGPGGTASSSSKLARGDRKLLEDLIEANAAEVQTGQLALQKAQGAEAKTFAQKMVDDHTKSLQELQQFAQGKGVTPKNDTDLQHKAMAKALGGLEGARFDEQYMKRVGVNDHERTIQLLQKTQKNAKDSELKALAQKMLPTVEEHLHLAQQATGKSAGKSAGKAAGNTASTAK